MCQRTMTAPPSRRFTRSTSSDSKAAQLPVSTPDRQYFIVGQLHESLPLEVRVKAAAIIAVVNGDQHVPRRLPRRRCCPAPRSDAQYGCGVGCGAAGGAGGVPRDLRSALRTTSSSHHHRYQRARPSVPLVKLLPGPHGERAVRLPLPSDKCCR